MLKNSVTLHVYLFSLTNKEKEGTNEGGITGLCCFFSIYYTVIGSIDTSVRGRRSHGSVHTQILESRFSRVRRENRSKCIRKHLFSLIWNKQQFKCHKCRAILSHHPDCIRCTLHFFLFFCFFYCRGSGSQTVPKQWI